MKQGSTPTYTFTTPVDASNITAYSVIFEQESAETSLEITSGGTLSGASLSVTLTQAQTLAFAAADDVLIEVIFLTSGGVCYRSAIIRERVYKTLKPEAISNA